MAASYPTSIKSFTTRSNGQTIDASHVNDLQDEVNAIETDLINGMTNTLKPKTNDGAALGTTALMWSDLFLASGAVINFNNGNVTVTHSAGNLAIAGGNVTFTGGTLTANTPGINLTQTWNNVAATFSATTYTITETAAGASSRYFEIRGGSSGTTDEFYVQKGGTVYGVKLTSGGNITMAAASKFYLDGGGDTYIYESAANRIRFTVGGTDHMLVGGNALELLGSTSLIVPATQKIYLDGGGDTYIYESSANTLWFVTGGNPTQLNSTGLAVYAYPSTGAAANLYSSDGDYIYKSTSSIRYKHDIAILNPTDATAAVMAMRPITYRGKTDNDQRRYVGFIAEEMQQIAPLLCTYDEGGESGTPNYVTYDRVTAYLVSVVQQQQVEIDTLKTLIAER